MKNLRPTPPRSISELTHQWDALAEIRDQQLQAGLDISFARVVAPAALRLLDGADLSLLLEVGAGTGHFTALVSERATAVVGVEPSSACIQVARRVCATMSNVQLYQASLEDYSRTPDRQAATSAVALMVLMATPGLEDFVASLASVLTAGAVFVAVLPHPCFWARYWGYADAHWFDYNTEIFVEAPFSISSATTSIRTTHIHRPLSQYFATFKSGGFELDAVEEPMPTEEVKALYPAPWRFPRFIALRWTRL